MRMAIIHDGFLHVGGAEKVLLNLIELYPNADLFIPIINQKLKKNISQKTSGDIKTTFFSYLPFFYRHASFLKPLMVLYWEKLNLKKYDFILTSSHSFNSKLVNVTPGKKHLSYIYTPPRYLGKHFNEIKLIKLPLLSPIFKPLLLWLKSKDYASGLKPTVMIGISKTIQKRIKDTYGRQSLLIYPPVNTKLPIRKLKSPSYYLCFSRLVKQKGIDLAVKTFTKNNLPLTVVGTGPEIESLKKIAGRNITFLGFVEDKKMSDVFDHTIALVNCAIEEDFGMVNVEAAARGIPIIAYRSGGLTETVIENKTGVFFNQHTVESLSEAIYRFNKQVFKAIDCHNFAQKFSKEIFEKKIETTVNYLMNHD